MNQEAVIEALRDAFPDLPSSRVSWFRLGFGSVTLELDGRIFRVARSERAASGHALERRLLPLLHDRLSARVPDPRWYVSSAPGLPFGALGYVMLPGNVLTADAAAKNMNAMAMSLAEFLISLHRFDARAIPNLPTAQDVRNNIEDLHRSVLPVLRDALDPGEMHAVERWWEEFLEDSTLRDYGPCLRHGDFWQGNILTSHRAAGITAVLDWEKAAVGDPAQDLATLRHLGTRVANAVLEEYVTRLGVPDPGLRHRVDRYWQLREFTGIVGAVEMHDVAELAESVAKLRAGPVLNPQ